MKKVFICLACFLLMEYYMVRAQNNSVFTLLKNESVNLKAEGRGTIQWEKSTDGKEWVSIPGANTKELNIIAEENIYLRARFSEGTCDPVYSQSTFVRVRRDQERKNIVFILIDDMGWKDLGCYGSDYYETPRIDELASQGVRFTQAYAAHAVCSPTRASLVTGKYPDRLHITAFIPGSERDYARLKHPVNWSSYLRMSEITYAEVFREYGYQTFHAGKWHLGFLGPEYHGFDHVTDNDYNTIHPEDPKNVMYYTNKTIDFIEAHKDQPFIAVVSHNTVHVPLEGKPDLIAKYQAKEPGSNGQNDPTMGAMIEYLDSSVGILVDKLKELSLLENTYIIFFSDNGGLGSATSNKPLRSGKSQLYEGGIRVPMIVTGPGLPGDYLVTWPVISNDLFPTMLSMAGIEQMPDVHSDGLSLLPLLTAEKRALDRENLYWYYPHYQTLEPHGAVRSGNWKLIEFYEQGRVELYDLANDLSESRDLSNTLPDKALELKQLLDNHLLRTGAQRNTLNPDYDPSRETESHYGDYDYSEYQQPEYLNLIKDN